MNSNRPTIWSVVFIASYGLFKPSILAMHFDESDNAGAVCGKVIFRQGYEACALDPDLMCSP